MEGAVSRRLEKMQGYTLLELLVVVAIIGVILAIAVPYYTAYKRSACDTTAQADLSKMGPAIQKLGSELSRYGCTSTLDSVAWDDAKLAALAGRYYGWEGTSAKCGVVVWYDAANQRIKAAAQAGSSPRGGNTRFIFSIPQWAGPEDSVKEGAIDGSAKPYPYDSSRTSGMVRSDCCTGVKFGGVVGGAPCP